jgi:hypothetical protein
MNAYKLGFVLVFSNKLVEAYNLLLMQLTWMYDSRELIAMTPSEALPIKLRASSQ